MSKQKTLISIILIILLIIAGSVYYFKYNNPKLKESQEQVQIADSADTTEKSDIIDFSGKFNDLISLDKSMKCTVSDEDTFSGTTFVDGNKIRSFYTIAIPQEGEMVQKDSYMVSDGEYIYIWTSDTNQGMKAKFSEYVNQAEEADTQNTASSAQNIPTNKEMNYKCEPWTVTPETFEIPSDIEFTDFSALLNTGEGTVTQDAACAACGYMQDDAQKQECLASLNCK